MVVGGKEGGVSKKKSNYTFLFLSNHDEFCPSIAALSLFSPPCVRARVLVMSTFIFNGVYWSLRSTAVWWCVSHHPERQQASR